MTKMTKTDLLLLAVVLALAPVAAEADGAATATPALAVAQAPEATQVLVPAPATADAPAVPTLPAPVLHDRADDGRRTLRRLPANLGRSALGVFSGKSVVPALMGGVAAASASFLDDTVRNEVEGTELLGWGSTFETGGGPVYSTIFVAGLFTAGRFVHDGRFRATTYDMLDAAIVNFAYTEAIKYAVGRERPNGQDNKSFPSGHTSNAFTLATVAQLHYGWKVGIPSYVVAGLMGASRINQDKHWLSDVAAGAAVGTVVGLTVVRVNSRSLAPKGGQVSLSVTPILAHHTRGLQLSAVF
jgi:membrane-associated phospholipid phosphatase